MGFRTDYDSWPWHGHERQGAEDARLRGRKNRDLYDHYDGEHKRCYANAYDRAKRQIEDRRREEQEEERRVQERRDYEQAKEMQRQRENEELEEQEPEQVEDDHA